MADPIVIQSIADLQNLLDEPLEPGQIVILSSTDGERLYTVDHTATKLICHTGLSLPIVVPPATSQGPANVPVVKDEKELASLLEDQSYKPGQLVIMCNENGNTIFSLNHNRAAFTQVKGSVSANEAVVVKLLDLEQAVLQIQNTLADLSMAVVAENIDKLEKRLDAAEEDLQDLRTTSSTAITSLSTALDLAEEGLTAIDLRLTAVEEKQLQTDDQLRAIEQQLTDGVSTKLEEDIRVTGTSVGNLADGQLIAKGTTLTNLMKSMLLKRIAAVYATPSLSLSATGTSSAEVGTSISTVVSPTFTQNDGGVRTGYSLRRNGVEIQTAFSSYSETLALSDAAVSFVATSTYADGPIKNDNLGTPSPAGAIVAGIATSNTRTFQGYRRAFFGVPAGAYDTGAQVRGLALSLNSPTTGSVLSATSQTGARIVWAYPATLRNPTALSMVSGGFTFAILDKLARLADIQVSDAAGANPMTYKVFKYEPATSFTSANFSLTI